VAERRVAEALRTRASDSDPAADRQERGEPPAAPSAWKRDRQEQERDREPEDDVGDSWRADRERADHLRQTYGWRVPQPPPRAQPWLPLSRNDDRDYEPPDRSGPLAG
jgi:hypothetical protein